MKCRKFHQNSLQKVRTHTFRDFNSMPRYLVIFLQTACVILGPWHCQTTFKTTWRCHFTLFVWHIAWLLLFSMPTNHPNKIVACHLIRSSFSFCISMLFRCRTALGHVIVICLVSTKWSWLAVVYLCSIYTIHFDLNEVILDIRRKPQSACFFHFNSPIQLAKLKPFDPFCVSFEFLPDCVHTLALSTDASLRQTYTRTCLRMWNFGCKYFKRCLLLRCEFFFHFQCWVLIISIKHSTISYYVVYHFHFNSVNFEHLILAIARQSCCLQMLSTCQHRAKWQSEGAVSVWTDSVAGVWHFERQHLEC